MTRYRAFVSVAVGIALAIACSSQSSRNLDSDAGSGDASVGDDDDDTGSDGGDGSGGRAGLGGSEEMGGFPGLGGLIGLGGVVIEIDGGPPPADGGPVPDATPSMGGSGGNIEPPVTGANAFMTAYLTGFCEASARCCAETANPVPADPCVDALLPGFLETYGDLDANPNVEFQPEYADSCVTMLEELGCDDSVPEECGGALFGTLPPGSPCTVDFECTTGPVGMVYCEIDPWEPGVNTVCVAYSGDQTGQPCTETCTHADGYVECFSTGGEYGRCITNLGFFCDETSWTCLPLRAEGESCSYTEECQPGTACVLGLCVPESQVGEPCDPIQSEPLVCAPDAYCTSVGECAPAGPTGEPCVADEECLSDLCSSNATCESPTLLSCDTMSIL